MTPTKAEALSDAELEKRRAVYAESYPLNDAQRLLATIADRDAKIAALRSPPVPEGVFGGLLDVLTANYPGSDPLTVEMTKATAILTYMTSAGYVRVSGRDILAKYLFDRHTGRIESHENPVSCFDNPKCPDCTDSWAYYRDEADALITALKGPT